MQKFSKIFLSVLSLYFLSIANFSNAQSESVTVNVSANVPVPSTGSGGGGGGGGGSGTSSTTSVSFKGRAYPLSKVFILKDGQIVTQTIAGPNASFSVSVSGLSTGNYTFSVYGEDDEGRKSSLFTFPVFVTEGANTEISDIFIAPTIAVDKKEVKQGDNIAIFGQAVPNSDVTISVNSPVEFFRYTQTDKNGVYLLNFDSSPLEMGQHSTKSKVATLNQISPFGRIIGFRVGTENIPSDGNFFLMGDLNDDGRVNLIDFSIAAFWYKKVIDVSMQQKDIERLNADGKIDLIDFSIMAFHWTG